MRIETHPVSSSLACNDCLLLMHQIAPEKVVKMPEKPKSRSSLSAVKFGKEKKGSERDSEIKEKDSNEDVFSMKWFILYKT